MNWYSATLSTIGWLAIPVVLLTNDVSEKHNDTLCS